MNAFALRLIKSHRVRFVNGALQKILKVMSPLKFLIFAALATAACAGGGRRRLPDPVPAPMPDPNFMEVSIVPCDASNNFCGSITTPPPIMEGTGGFYLPGK
ncbi:unnamed protein product, partial [Iphiclides podalirius]